MNCQFGNSYTSVQCKDGTNMVFNEVRVLDYLQIKKELIREEWVI